jgi:hypothetical protein
MSGNEKMHRYFIFAETTGRPQIHPIGGMTTFSDSEINNLNSPLNQKEKLTTEINSQHTYEYKWKQTTPDPAFGGCSALKRKPGFARGQ